jgi:archaetidylinositol phosphate synthase
VVLDNYRSSLDWWLLPLAKAFRHIHPDVFTWTSLAIAILGGVAFWKSGPGGAGLDLLLVAWFCVLLNSVLDLLDGKIAKMTGQDTARGDYLDHTVDRLSDAALITGVAFSGWARLELGVFALLATLLTSYMATQAQAVGLKRSYAGLLGRADRMVLLLVLPLAEWAWSVQGYGAPWKPAFMSLLEIMLAYFAVMGGITAVQRFVSGLRSFTPEGDVK